MSLRHYLKKPTWTHLSNLLRDWIGLFAATLDLILKLGKKQEWSTSISWARHSRYLVQTTAVWLRRPTRREDQNYWYAGCWQNDHLRVGWVKISTVRRTLFSAAPFLWFAERYKHSLFAFPPPRATPFRRARGLWSRWGGIKGVVMVKPRFERTAGN